MRGKLESIRTPLTDINFNINPSIRYALHKRRGLIHTRTCVVINDQLKQFTLLRLSKLSLIMIIINKSAKWHCGRHTLICNKNLFQFLKNNDI